ncbi:MAG: galactokinase [Puniceicoccaceae bacterium]
MTDFIKDSEDSARIVERVKEQFARTWGHSPSVVAVTPGRVNVIGEHVDYNGGWVLPAAIERYMVMAVRPNGTSTVRLASANFPERAEFAIDALSPDNGRDWGRYIRGVMAGLEKAGIPLQGFDAQVESTIPVGGGLSSSAALEAAAGLALLAMAGKTMDRFDLAKLCQKAEHDYADVPCGIMDQAAVLNCQEGHLLFLDCEYETFEQAPFDAPEWRLMIINSGVAHELADGEYAKRRAACHQAAEKLGVASLRHIPMDSLDEVLENLQIDKDMVRAVRHNVTENERTHKTVKALADGDIRLAGQLLNASHASLRDDYRVSCDELDFIAATAQKLEGVAGCRMTGGGFGGSCIALVHKDEARTVAEAVATAFAARFGQEPGIFITAPADGGRVEILDN